MSLKLLLGQSSPHFCAMKLGPWWLTDKLGTFSCRTEGIIWHPTHPSEFPMEGYGSNNLASHVVRAQPRHGPWAGRHLEQTGLARSAANGGAFHSTPNTMGTEPEAACRYTVHTARRQGCREGQVRELPGTVHSRASAAAGAMCWEWYLLRSLSSSVAGTFGALSACLERGPGSFEHERARLRRGWSDPIFPALRAGFSRFNVVRIRTLQYPDPGRVELLSMCSCTPRLDTCRRTEHACPSIAVDAHVLRLPRLRTTELELPRLHLGFLLLLDGLAPARSQNPLNLDHMLSRRCGIYNAVCWGRGWDLFSLQVPDQMVPTKCYGNEYTASVSGVSFSTDRVHGGNIISAVPWKVSCDIISLICDIMHCTRLHIGLNPARRSNLNRTARQ